MEIIPIDRDITKETIAGTYQLPYGDTTKGTECETVGILTGGVSNACIINPDEYGNLRPCGNCGPAKTRLIIESFNIGEPGSFTKFSALNTPGRSYLVAVSTEEFPEQSFNHTFMIENGSLRHHKTETPVSSFV